MGFGVCSLGFGVGGLGFRVWGFGLGVWDLGFGLSGEVGAFACKASASGALGLMCELRGVRDSRATSTLLLSFNGDGLRMCTWDMDQG